MLRRVALSTLLAFGCATARPPAPATAAGGAPPSPPPRVALAAPSLELWMEGTKAIDPVEGRRALDESRAALARAVEGRGLDDVADPQALLVVRARELARTSERKTSQIVSVVGVVVVIIAVVIAIIGSSDHGSKRPRSAGGHAVVPVGGGPVSGWRGQGFAPRPWIPPPVGVSVGASVFVPVGPAPEPAGPPPEGLAAPFDTPAPDRFLAGRGWLDGDATELTVELVDPVSGAVNWRTVVKSSADPRNAQEVSELLDRALASQPFGRRVAPLGAPGGQDEGAVDTSAYDALTPEPAESTR